MASGRKRLRRFSGALASPVPCRGLSSPASAASSAASAARAPEARRGGHSGPPGKVRCMCSECPDAGVHRLPTLELVKEPGSAARAWLRALGVRWETLAERFAAAKAAGRKLTLRVANGHWSSWSRGAVPDRIYIRRLRGDGGAYVSSMGRVTPAVRDAAATLRLRKALGSGRMDRIADVAAEHASELDSALVEIDNLRAQNASLVRALSAAEARVEADSRYTVAFRGTRLPAFRFANIKDDDEMTSSFYGVTGDVIVELAGLLRLLGFDDAPGLSATAFHLARAEYEKTTGRTSPDVGITVQTTDMHVRRKGSGGAQPVLDVTETVAWVLHSLRGDVRAAQAEPIYGVSSSVLSRGFQKAVVALDNLWPVIFPPMTYQQALELMPLSLIARLFGKGTPHRGRPACERQSGRSRACQATASRGSTP